MLKPASHYLFLAERQRLVKILSEKPIVGKDFIGVGPSLRNQFDLANFWYIYSVKTHDNKCIA
jgi:hypothetical protein